MITFARKSCTNNLKLEVTTMSKKVTQKTIIDPNAKASSKEGIYGLPFKENEAKIVYLPIPWDVTTSYQAGTSKGPGAILKASEQIDFFDLDYGNAYEAGLYMQKESSKIKKMNSAGRILAKKIIDADDELMKKSKALQGTLKKVNELCDSLNDEVYKLSKNCLLKKQIPIVVGGDHATPFGAIKAYAESFENFGILHFDAHSDTRNKYMGFENSHASIMRNVMEKILGVKKLVQVGIRDFCEEEYLFTEKHPNIKVYFDQHLAQRKISGEAFEKIAREIINHLPQNVYISFDIDGLDPRFCPHTGTPVPGGLEYSEVVFIINELVKSKRTLVGFDLVEVAPSMKDKNDEWDANVGMRLLYKMTAATLSSQGLISKS